MTNPRLRVREFSHGQQPAALSLDAAGTLIDVAEPVAATYVRIARAHGIDVTPVEVGRRFAVVFAEAPPMAFGPVAPDVPGRLEQPGPLEQLERGWWREVVRGCLGLDRDDPRLEPCFTALYDWYSQPSAWRLYDDVLPMLDALRTAGVPVAVLSNFDSRLIGVAKGLGLTARVRSVLFSTAIGYAKPDARAFAAAVEALGVPAGEVLHVGDRHAADVDGARAAGCQALLLERAGKPSADTIVSLSALISSDG